MWCQRRGWWIEGAGCRSGRKLRKREIVSGSSTRSTLLFIRLVLFRYPGYLPITGVMRTTCTDASAASVYKPMRHHGCRIHIARAQEHRRPASRSRFRCLNANIGRRGGSTSEQSTRLVPLTLIEPIARGALGNISQARHSCEGLKYGQVVVWDTISFTQAISPA
jgi:hypothetical protein